MKRDKFFDFDNLISWDIFPSTCLLDGATTQTLKARDKYCSILNTWQDKDIHKFILDDGNVGDLIKGMLDEEYSEYLACFATDSKNKPLGVAVISLPSNKTSTIEYVIIDPKQRRKGIGTRMLKSITENLIDFSYRFNKANQLYATARKDNEGSIKALLKSNFVVKPSPRQGTLDYKEFYFNLKDKNMNM